jgi:signal transduction histidine kinase
VYANTKNDSIKVKALMELANHKRINLRQRDSSIIVFNIALQLARQKGLYEQQSEIMLLLANTYKAFNLELNTAYQLTRDALELSRQHKYKALEADLLLSLSNQLVNKPDSSKLLIEQSIRLSTLENLPVQLLNAFARKGEYYAAVNADSSKYYLFKSLSVARESNLPDKEAALLQKMAGIYSINFWGDSSNYFISEAVKIARSNFLIDQELRLLRLQISSESGFFNRDSFNTNFDRILTLCRQYKRDSLSLMSVFAQSSRDMGNYPRSLQTYFQTLRANEVLKDSAAIESDLYGIGLCYQAMRDYKNSNDYLYEAKKYGTKNPFINIFVHDDLSKNYLALKQPDSSRYYAEKSYQIATNYYGGEAKIYGGVLNDLGSIYFELGEDSIAINYLRRSYVDFTKNQVQYLNYCHTTMSMAKYFNKKGLTDSSFIYAKLCFNTARDKGFLSFISESSELISFYFQQKHNKDSAFYYQQAGFEAFKKLYSTESNREFQNLALAEQQRKQELEQEKELYKTKIRSNVLIGSLFTLSVIVFFLFRNNRQKQKAKFKIEEAYNQLKSTQSQLIQSEKMASLGELTAGIAHEIQNPLNFVNNFSEINKELLSEMTDEIVKGHFEEAKAIAKNVTENEEKIIAHGKRADAIVKGMLQHSRSNSGIKEPTDINALAEEYLRLSFHGLRAKDKGFNSGIKTDFDRTIGNIDVIPQEIGRVLLNLYNNAFYAVQEKTKILNGSFHPLVSVVTKKEDGKIQISVKDNGDGIPQKIADKIFQPFFTTKPTGQGTGLGLSLSYDIVKAHGGELKVETKEGEGTTFIIKLPIP